MNVYRLGSEDANRYDSLSVVGGNYRPFELFGKPAQRWKAPRIKRYPSQLRADLYNLSDNPIATVGAWKVLAPLLAPWVEALALAADFDDLVLLNVVTLCPAIDQSASKLHWFEHIILEIEHLALDVAAIQAPIFRLSHAEAHGVYCGDELRDLVLKNGLRGWGFEPVWGDACSRPAEAPPQDVYWLLQQLPGLAAGVSAAELPTPVRWLVQASLVDAEVGNGGFSQLLYNGRTEALTSGREAFDVVAPEVGALLSEVEACWHDHAKEHAAFYRKGVFGSRSLLARKLDDYGGRYQTFRADLNISAFAAQHESVLREWVTSRS